MLAQMKIQLISVNRPLFYFHIVLCFSRKSGIVAVSFVFTFSLVSLKYLLSVFFFYRLLFLYAITDSKASGTVDFLKVLHFSLAFASKNIQNLPLSFCAREKFWARTSTCGQAQVYGYRKTPHTFIPKKLPVKSVLCHDFLFHSW